MKRSLMTVVAVLAFSLQTESFAQVEQEYLSKGPIFVKNVTVIDGMGSKPVAGQDILIEDGKIAAITATGKTIAPTGAQMIEGTGLTAMPGLIDMHFHLKGGWTGGQVFAEKYPVDNSHKGIQQTLAALLYSGVTAALDMGSTQSFIVEQKRKIDAGEYIAPRYYIMGVPFSQEPSGWDGAVREETVGEPPTDALSTKVDTQDQQVLGAILDKYKKDGINFIKLYSGISALSSTHLIKEAKKREITTTADLWQMNMNAGWMRMTGLDGWAHATPNPVSEKGLRWMAQNGKWVIATMNVGEKLSGLRVKDEQGKELLFSNPLVVDIWGEQVVRDFYDSYPKVRENLYEGRFSFYQVFNFGDLSLFRKNFMVNIKKAYDADVLIAGGTDAPAYPTLWTGETMHRELELFVMAGIPPLDALKMCTYNAARILKKEKEFGALEKGKAADILVVSGQPWKNISDTRNIEHVIVRGGILDRQKLLKSWK
jgi:imidazolonepropionase-like amidohydrolase